jgi:hypothetical protein
VRLAARSLGLKLMDDDFVTDADKATIEALPDWMD